MGALANFYASSIGAKVVMAMTGFLWFVFLIGHMVGNWQVFQGPEPLNAYAYFLQSHPVLLWTARAGLTVTFILHVWSATRLTLANQKARPQAYVKKSVLQATWASRNMFITGVMVLSFLAYHLLQFTYGVTNPEISSYRDPLGHSDVYRMVVAGFQIPAISAAYFAAMILLGLHLQHGVSSMFQSVGLNRPRYNHFVNAIGPLFAIVMTAGNSAMPIAILAGWVQ